MKSNLTDRSYKLEVYGVGNMSYVGIEAGIVMNGFRVRWY